MALVLFSYLATPPPAAAAEAHVVSLSELQNELHISQRARAKDLDDIQRVLSLPVAQDTLAKTHVNMERVMTVIADLDDGELTRLADQARVAEQDVEGGLIVGLLALIGLIVVIVVVLSVVGNDE